MILGIEGSCNDRSLAVFDGRSGQFLYEKTSSQLAARVVPQLAAREHSRNFPTLLEELKQQVPLSETTKIAVSCGPDLPGSLTLGIAFAGSRGLILRREVVSVNRLRGHILSPFMGKDLQKIQSRKNSPSIASRFR
jgi:N6-L-threonylcarbamoyladenine synthase